GRSRLFVSFVYSLRKPAVFSRTSFWTAWTISSKIDRMRHLSWRREDIRRDLDKLSQIWRVILGVIFLITTLFVMTLMEEFHIIQEAWTHFLVAVIYALAIFAAVRFLRLKISN